MHLHLRSTQRCLNAGDLLGIDIAIAVHAQDLGQRAAELRVTAAQLAQGLLQQFPLCHCDPASVGTGRDSHRHEVPTQRLLACAPVIAAGLHKCSDSGQFEVRLDQLLAITPLDDNARFGRIELT